MGKKRSINFIMLICIFFIAGISVDSWAGTEGTNFKVSNRGTINYTVVVPANAKSLKIAVRNQSQHLKMKVTPPDPRYVGCRTTTWTSSIGLKNPMKCSFSNPVPGVWKIKITGSVHVGNLDKYPYVTGHLTVNTSSGQPRLSGPGTKGPHVDSWAGTEGTNFKVGNRGTINYTVVVPANAKSLKIAVTNQSHHLKMKVTPPDPRYAGCRSTTWTSSIGLKNPMKCSFSNPMPGVWKIKITGAVHVGNLDKYPYVTGHLTVNTSSGQPRLSGPGTEGPHDEAPPGHPKVEIPEGQADRPARIAEAGTWMGSATTIEYDSHVKAYIKKKDYDMFKFYFPGGGLRAYSKGNLDLVADVFNSDQERIARDRNSGSGSNFLFQGSYPAGFYYIQIRVMYHGGEGPYELILGNGQNRRYVESA